MRIICFLLFTLMVSQLNGQIEKSPEEWYNNYLDYYSLDDKDYKSEMTKIDYSELYLKTPSKFIYGIIGSKMQRLELKWISINKDPVNHDTYYVYGKTRVKENICEFTGILKIKTIRLHKLNEYDMPYSAKVQPEKIGVVFCDYRLTENSKINNTGVFQGICATEFYIDNDTLHYNNLRDGADDMTNNSFVGTWTNYKTANTLICNWGDYRIPNLGLDFDCGAACFEPCKEYDKYGWENFISIEDVYNPDYSKINKWWE